MNDRIPSPSTCLAGPPFPPPLPQERRESGETTDGNKPTPDFGVSLGGPGTRLPTPKNPHSEGTGCPDALLDHSAADLPEGVLASPDAIGTHSGTDIRLLTRAELVRRDAGKPPWCWGCNEPRRKTTVHADLGTGGCCPLDHVPGGEAEERTAPPRKVSVQCLPVPSRVGLCQAKGRSHAEVEFEYVFWAVGRYLGWRERVVAGVGRIVVCKRIVVVGVG